MMDPITELDAKILDSILNRNDSLTYINDAVFDANFLLRINHTLII